MALTKKTAKPSQGMQLSFELDGEMTAVRPDWMSPAQHSRLLCLELIRNEEASCDPELLRVAAFRRRCLATAEPRA